MYQSLKEDLQSVLEAIKTNQSVDWEENNPADEFASLANLLETAINKDRSQDKALESLSHYTCGSDAQGEYLSQEELLELLQKQAEIDGEVKADDIVAMWEPLEYRYTVNQLLDEIGI